MAMQIPESLQKSVEATKVEYVRLGKSGLRVSVPILGAMSFGSPEWFVFFTIPYYSNWHVSNICRAPWVIDEEKVHFPVLDAF
jgi:aryl-alcohol dehydrogenase-like predicted oxidoreductase